MKPDKKLMTVDSAKKLLEAIDPVIAVAGKARSFILELSPDTIQSKVKDEASVMVCYMTATMTGIDYTMPADISSIEIPIRPAVDALHVFGSDEVTVSLSAMNEIVISNDEGRRRAFRILKSGTPARYIKCTPEAECDIPSGKLQDLAGLERIDETVHFSVREGRLSVIAQSDTESDEISIPTPLLTDQASAYAAEYLTAVIRRIHTDDDVHLGYSTAGLLKLTFGYEGTVSYEVLIAPRVERD